MVLSIIYMLIAGLIGLLTPWVLRIAIDSIKTETISFHLLKFSSFLMGIVIIQGIFRFYIRKILIGVSRKIEYSLRIDLFAHIQTLDLFYFTENQTGSIMALLTNDIDAVRNFLGPGIMNLFDTIFVFFSTLIVMFLINYKLTLYSLVAIPILPFIVWKLSSIIYERSKKSQEQYAIVSARTQESFSGIKVVKSFTQEQNEINEFSILNGEFIKRNLSLARARAVFWPVMILIGGIGSLIVLYAGGRQVIANEISLGEFVQFSAYIMIITWPLISLGWVINLIQRGGASMGRINEVFRREPVIKSPDNPAPVSKIMGNLKFENIYFSYPKTTRHAHIAFKDSSPSLSSEVPDEDMKNEKEPIALYNQNSYDGSDLKQVDVTNKSSIVNPQNKNADYILKNINFEIRKGMTMGLTGLTGSGKTSLVNLIPRIYDPDLGKILIDGIDIRKIPLELLRKSIGLVTQEPFLFSKSIKDNIIYGREFLFECIPQEELNTMIESAAKTAMLHDEIMGFPHGYETIIGERGVTLSGGQKQRLAIARAMITEPSILILDDSFSSVDTQTEELILRSLKEKTKDITTILISHRISTIKDADLIIVMDNGSISEIGPHSTLIKKTGIYKRLYLQQQLSLELEDEIEEI
ncbi:MAG: ABC transporter ATP-binding protein/permease [Actinobacteria bacterium]|nr:ABC transporter ATP-binding protein/permease [Actinomycetota bacterium]